MRRKVAAAAQGQAIPRHLEGCEEGYDSFSVEIFSWSIRAIRTLRPLRSGARRAGLREQSSPPPVPGRPRCAREWIIRAANTSGGTVQAAGSGRPSRRNSARSRLFFRSAWWRAWRTLRTASSRSRSLSFRIHSSSRTRSTRHCRPARWARRAPSATAQPFAAAGRASPCRDDRAR
jgi:hypothetical protein